MQTTIARIALGAATALAAVTSLVGSPATATAAPAPAPAPITATAAIPQQVAPATGLFGESAYSPVAPGSLAPIAPLPISITTYKVGPSYYLTNWQKQAWFNYLLQTIDPGRRGIWILDLYGTRTSTLHRGMTYPQSYGTARPIVYIYAADMWNTWEMRNVMWHERAHVKQLADIGYDRSKLLLGGISGLEATAVCTEHMMNLARPGWGCSSYDLWRARSIWNGTLR